MKINIMLIENSGVIILPRAIIEQCEFRDIIKVEIKDRKLILSYEKPRKGWKEAFKIMAKSGDDKLLDSEIFTLFSDEKDWKW